jgi:integrase/recombinase XerD
MPGGAESWTVLDDSGVPAAPIEAYLAHLQALDRSPATARAYAFSLKLWFEFLSRVAVDWDAATAEHVSRFVAWLWAPADNVVGLGGGSAWRSAATVNRHCATCPRFQLIILPSLSCLRHVPAIAATGTFPGRPIGTGCT